MCIQCLLGARLGSRSWRLKTAKIRSLPSRGSQLGVRTWEGQEVKGMRYSIPGSKLLCGKGVKEAVSSDGVECVRKREGVSNTGRAPTLTERSRNCTLSLWLEVRGGDNSRGESWEGKNLVYVIVWPWSCRGVRSLNRFSQWGNAVRPKGVAGGEDGRRQEDRATAPLSLIQHLLNATLASGGRWESQVDTPASGSPGMSHTPEVLHGKPGSSIYLLSLKHHWDEKRHVQERTEP